MIVIAASRRVHPGFGTDAVEVVAFVGAGAAVVGG